MVESTQWMLTDADCATVVKAEMLQSCCKCSSKPVLSSYYHIVKKKKILSAKLSVLINKKKGNCVKADELGGLGAQGAQLWYPGVRCGAQGVQPW